MRLTNRFNSLLICIFVLLWACSDGTKNNDSQPASPATEEVQSFNDWEDVVSKARGQTVYLNAWGGSDLINTYIAWAGKELDDKYGITLKHVKVDDIATAVSRVLGEFTAGKKTDEGSIDLMWINGENFRSMKESNLLFGPFLDYLPNTQYIDTSKPSIASDFGTPTEGYEAPWGSAQLVFVYDSSRIPTPPATLVELIEYAEANPGRITYPKPPHYLGTTFLKQVLYSVSPNPQLLQQPATDEAFEAHQNQLWPLIDRLHKVAWNSGSSFPATGQDLFRLLNDREVDFALSFSPGEATANIKEGLLPSSARTFIFDNGTIGNTHFLAIPANSSSKEAALVAINFLVSPDAQLRKQNPQYWGDFTVLNLGSVDSQIKQAFDNLPLGVATLSPADLQPTLAEPHASWVERIEKAWQERYL